MKNVPSDMNVMIPQIQTYVRLVQTQHNSDKLLVRFVIPDSTVKTQQILTNVLLGHMRQKIEQSVVTVNLGITACLDFNSNAT